MKKNFKIIAIIMLLMFLVFFVSCGEKKSNDKNLEITSIGDSEKTADITEEEQEKVITMDNYSTYEEALKANWYCINEYIVTDVKFGRSHDYGAQTIEENVDYLTEEEFNDVLATNEYDGLGGRIELDQSTGKFFANDWPNQVVLGSRSEILEKYTARYNIKVGQKVLDCHRNRWNVNSYLVFEDSSWFKQYNFNYSRSDEAWDNAQTIEELNSYDCTFIGITLSKIYYDDGTNALFGNFNGESKTIYYILECYLGRRDDLDHYFIFLSLTKNENN